MLDPVEILDLQHCRKQDPMWAEKKARHCLADAAACDARVGEAYAAALITHGVERVEKNLAHAKSMEAMAERYRARARILMGEDK
jgi:hypothetical protein